jgi:RNA recognition motif-containing protein
MLNSYSALNASVFIGNIPYDVSLAQLQDHMAQAGKLVHVELFSDELGNSRGCATAEYYSHQEAQLSIQLLHNSKLGARYLIVKEDQSLHRKPVGSCQITLDNLPCSVTWQQLKDVCRDIGSVLRSDILQDKHGRSLGVGKVLFEHPQEAEAAYRLLNGAIFNDRFIKVEVD